MTALGVAGAAGVAPADLRGLLFDKDGTLFGFQATWGGWGADLVADLAAGDAELERALADKLGIDRAARAFRPDSIVVAATLRQSMAEILPLLPDWEPAALHRHLIATSEQVSPVEATPLAPLLARLGAAELALGVATNDVESSARAQLARLSLGDAFGFVAGADSGHGAKPGPGQCLAFAAAMGLSPGEVAMIGDSTHDLHAGRAAGMVCIGVLTGTASRHDLAPHADAVLPDIGHLPEWLGL